MKMAAYCWGPLKRKKKLWEEKKKKEGSLSLKFHGLLKNNSAKAIMVALRENLTFFAKSRWTRLFDWVVFTGVLAEHLTLIFWCIVLSHRARSYLAWFWKFLSKDEIGEPYFEFFFTLTIPRIESIQCL